jgi:hypothetical protein
MSLVAVLKVCLYEVSSYSTAYGLIIPYNPATSFSNSVSSFLPSASIFKMFFYSYIASLFAFYVLVFLSYNISKYTVKFTLFNVILILQLNHYGMLDSTLLNLSSVAYIFLLGSLFILLVFLLEHYIDIFSLILTLTFSAYILVDFVHLYEFSYNLGLFVYLSIGIYFSTILLIRNLSYGRVHTYLKNYTVERNFIVFDTHRISIMVFLFYYLNDFLSTLTNFQKLKLYFYTDTLDMLLLVVITATVFSFGYVFSNYWFLRFIRDSSCSMPVTLSLHAKTYVKSILYVYFLLYLMACFCQASLSINFSDKWVFLFVALRSFSIILDSYFEVYSIR